MGNSELQLNIISAEKTVFSGKVASVVIPGVSGKFGVLPDHAPLISPLMEGQIVYVIKGEEQIIDVKGGIAEVIQNIVTICVA